MNFYAWCMEDSIYLASDGRTHLRRTRCDGKVRCPFCGRKIKKSDKECPHCEEDLTTVESLESFTHQREMARRLKAVQ